MASNIISIAPVSQGGRYQQVAGTSVVPITASDSIPIGPCAQLIVTTAGSLALGMWDGTTVTLTVTLAQVLNISPRLVHTASTAVVAAIF